MKIRRALSYIRDHQNFLAISTSLVVVSFNVFSIAVPNYVNGVYVAIIFSKYFFTGYLKSFELSLAVSMLALFAIPAGLSVFGSEGQYVVLLAVAYIFTEVLRAVSNRMNRRLSHHTPRNKKFNLFLWAFLIAIVVVGWQFRFGLGSTINVFIFFLPFAASLVVMERSIDTISIAKIYLLAAAYFILILYYSMFFWSGFGRLVISAYIMIPILIINQHRDIGIRAWQLTLIIPSALVGAFVLRFQESDLQRLMEDSWVSHLTLTREMLDTLGSREPAGFSGYIDQYLLLFLQWVPRSIWPTKPVGVGLTFVDDWIGREGFDIGHSVALGFMGEALWYLGSSFVFGLVFIFFTIILLRFFAGVLDRGGYTLVAVVDSFLPSFFWGGMGTYGSRFWFFFLPMLFTMYLLRFRVRGKMGYRT